MSQSRWKRSMFGAWPITPALKNAKVISRTGSTQNSTLPAP